jgi:hypothetical protein
MPSLYTLECRQRRLIQEVVDNLDFLVGSVSSKGFRYPAYNLTTKVDGKTKTRHIPKDMLPLVKRLTGRHRKLKTILRKLGEVNWQLLLQRADNRIDGAL